MNNLARKLVNSGLVFLLAFSGCSQYETKNRKFSSLDMPFVGTALKEECFNENKNIESCFEYFLTSDKLYVKQYDSQGNIRHTEIFDINNQKSLNKFYAFTKQNSD